MTLERLDVRLERQQIDIPRHDQWEYTYFAYFRVKGTDVVFLVRMSKHSAPGHLKNYPALTAKLGPDEIALLQSYSRETTTPAGIWLDDAESVTFFADEDYPNKDLWLVEPAAIGPDPYFREGEYLYERLPDGAFRLLHHDSP